MKSYPSLSTAFNVTSSPYWYSPSSEDVGSMYVLSLILKLYLFLLYKYSTSVLPSLSIVTVFNCGLVNPSYVFTLGVTSVPSIPSSLSVSAIVYVSAFKSCFLCITLYPTFLSTKLSSNSIFRFIFINSSFAPFTMNGINNKPINNENNFLFLLNPKTLLISLILIRILIYYLVSLGSFLELHFLLYL